MKNLIIVGAGDFGHELVAVFLDSLYLKGLSFKGYIDDDEQLSGKVLSKITDYWPQENDVFAFAIAKTVLKEKIVSLLITRGAQFVNLIHKTAIVLSQVEENSGLIILPFSTISCNVSVGKHVLISTVCTIGHDVVIDNYTTLSPHCSVSGHVKLGERVFMGSNASVLPGKKIAHDVMIGAGSVVTQDVTAGLTVVGIPAKPINK